MTRVAIAAGGTAGHVVPALAVADALRDKGAEVEFLGGERAEAELVPAAGYPFHPLRVAGLDRRNPLKAARAVLWAAAATARARRILRAMKPDVVLGGGGYVAAPAGLAARSLRRAPRPHRGRQPPGHRQPHARSVRRARLPVVRPARPRGSEVGRHRPPDSGRHRGCGPGRRPGAVRHRRRPRMPARVRWVARRAAPERGRARRVRQRRSVLGAARVRPARLRRPGAAASRSSDGPAHYKLHPYVTPFADAYAAADLATARAGGSVFELLAAGLPSILVPYPHATADHQTKNARWVERGGAAVVVPDDELDGPRLAREVAALLGSSERLRTMQRAALARWLARTQRSGSLTRSSCLTCK